MIDNVKACVLTAYAPNTSHGHKVEGSPYKRGQERLIRSLIYHGFRYDILAFQDFQTDDFDKTCGYNIKADALTVAINQGYERILWLDSSVWAIKPIEPLFDYIDENGWYFYSNGFNMAQMADDKALEHFGYTRDEAEKIPDLSSSMFGLHMGNPRAQEFAEEWIKTAKLGMWSTSREHGGGSKDPRFMFDRQDQSCASLLVHKLKLHMVGRNTFSAIANDTGVYPESVNLVMRGM